MSQLPRCSCHSASVCNEACDRGYCHGGCIFYDTNRQIVFFQSQILKLKEMAEQIQSLQSQVTSLEKKLEKVESASRRVLQLCRWVDVPSQMSAQWFHVLENLEETLKLLEEK